MKARQISVLTVGSQRKLRNVTIGMTLLLSFVGGFAAFHPGQPASEQFSTRMVVIAIDA